MKQQALEALDSMDDFARMADINAFGPHKVLEDFINNSFTSDQLKQAKVKVLREAAEACPGYAKASNLREYIRHMADELEAGK